MLDIREGDYLVIGTKEYSIARIAYWGGALGTTPLFMREANILASTKRSPDIDKNGQRGTAIAYLTTLYVTPFDVVTPGLTKDVPLDLPARTLRCYAADSDGYVEIYAKEHV